VPTVGAVFQQTWLAAGLRVRSQATLAGAMPFAVSATFLRGVESSGGGELLFRVIRVEVFSSSSRFLRSIPQVKRAAQCSQFWLWIFRRDKISQIRGLKFTALTRLSL